MESEYKLIYSTSNWPYRFEICSNDNGYTYNFYDEEELIPIEDIEKKISQSDNEYDYYSKINKIVVMLGNIVTRKELDSDTFIKILSITEKAASIEDNYLRIDSIPNNPEALTLFDTFTFDVFPHASSNAISSIGYAVLHSDLPCERKNLIKETLIRLSNSKRQDVRYSANLQLESIREEELKKVEQIGKVMRNLFKGKDLNQIFC